MRQVAIGEVDSSGRAEDASEGGPASARRTQEERRAETRTKLLDATIQSVLDVGYANTTTRRVAELAGVSQGAQTHHFPHRVDLVGAAVERLAERRIAELHEMASDLPAKPSELADVLLDLIWADFSSSTFAVFVKLWIAAADDPELYARLIPVEQRIARAIAELAAHPRGAQLGGVDMEQNLLLTLAAVRGLALVEHFEPRGRQLRDAWPMVKAGLIRSFLAES
jgi:AcrR family transcriptional regulator